MDAQRLIPALQIRPVDDDAPVEAARTQQRLIEDLGAVRRREDHNALARIKAVDLGEELVERLFALVVAAEFGISRPADRIDLIDEDDGRGDLCRLLEQVTHAACADADEHLHEVRAGDREERHVRLTGDGLCKQCFARARRADEQRALRQFRADGGVFLRIVQKVDDLDERFLCLVLSGHIRERHAGLLFHIDLGFALTDAAESAHAAHALRHRAHQQREQAVHEDHRQHPPWLSVRKSPDRCR